MKIICVGMNYPSHCNELHANEELVPEPVIFLKPDSALLRDRKPFFVPDFSRRIEYEAEVVARVCRLGKYIEPRFAHRYYDAVTVGIDFTARDMQRHARAHGNPWDLAKGFDGSAAVGDFVPLATLPPVQQLKFRLDIDDVTVQSGFTGDMIHAVDEVVSYISRFYTLKMGDLIYTGTPAGVGPVSIGQHFTGYLEDNKVLDFFIR